MCSTYEIFGISIPAYGTLIVIGSLFGLLVSYLLVKKNQPEFASDIVFSFLYGMIGVGIGGKLLFIIVELKHLIEAFRIGQGFKLLGIYILQGGYVFYGGLIGAFLMLLIYSRQFKFSLEKIILYLAPAIPLIHGFGRLGCLAAGCCYGIPCETFGYELNHSPIAPPGIKLFPTQLLEAIYCFFIFIVLFTLFKKIKNGYKLISIYILFYSPFRFLIEFVRGDIQRGFIGIISTSQFISILLMIITGIIYKKYQKLN
ncbi:MAG TPA: prolipoprotein diacylglyceryl transferase [Clostridiaceae bacterium]|nr:prolipoprotein diacylglyceryl transferase [Clostridiaceae bacterium]